nr:ABC transporter ATP-binding protein [uncultured Methanoregula sp.]
MTDHIAIRVKNLGKKYSIGGPQEPYHTLREAMVNSIKAPLQMLKRAPPEEGFWALKDVTLDISQGDVIGIIGRNGAGKSTFLKILSRITTPTEGSVEIHGRVGSLLEVGTGFHPEMTGRENIFLNGSILGMKKNEIEYKFDEIVKFSEIEKFIDTPVKRYSSGMYIRLAFAVAAHLEPEILLIDEVLAVGDAQFQKKCLGKMGEVGKEGRTVLFISHNMAAMRQLCPSCIWLANGKLEEIGQTENVIDHYLESTIPDAQTTVLTTGDDKKEVQLTIIRIIDDNGNENSQCNCDLPITIELIFNVKTAIPGLYGYIAINKKDGTLVMISDSFDNEPNSLDNLDPGLHRVHVKIPARTLGAGHYYISTSFAKNYFVNTVTLDSHDIVYSFFVFDETSYRGTISGGRGGFFSTKLKWELCKNSPPGT